MILSSFNESNGVLSRPSDMTDEQCEPASVWRGPMAVGTDEEMLVVVTCWKPTREELNKIERTGRVWLIVCGVTMPPVIVTGDSPFTEKV